MIKAMGVEAVCVGALATLAVASAALADTGTYEAVYSFAANYTSFEHGNGTVTGGSNRGTTTIIGSSGGVFVQGQSSAQECVILAKKTSAGIDLDSECTVTDVSGEKIFSHAVRRSGETTHGSGAGTNEILGGTGKYAGITGHCTYTVQFVPDNRGVATSKCQWQKP